MYLGAVHNPIEFDRFSLREKEHGLFNIVAQMLVMFELEGVARNERFTLMTDARFEGVVA